MWVMTKDGFISAVEHRKDASVVLVRSRTEEPLRYFCETMKIDEENIVHMDDADYVWRVEVTKQTLADFLANEVMNNLNYANFKSHCAAYGAPTKYTNFLHKVWSAGLDMQEGGLYNTKGKYHSFSGADFSDADWDEYNEADWPEFEDDEKEFRE